MKRFALSASLLIYTCLSSDSFSDAYAKYRLQKSILQRNSTFKIMEIEADKIQHQMRKDQNVKDYEMVHPANFSLDMESLQLKKAITNYQTKFSEQTYSNKPVLGKRISLYLNKLFSWKGTPVSFYFFKIFHKKIPSRLSVSKN